jgi:hypothetical protein
MEAAAEGVALIGAAEARIGFILRKLIYARQFVNARLSLR